MALHKITTNGSDIHVSFVFKNQEKHHGHKVVLCKLFIHGYERDAPQFIFWGRVEELLVLLGGVKTLQKLALNTALQSVRIHVNQYCPTHLVLNTVLTCWDDLLDLFEKNWKKSARGNQRRTQKV